MALIQCSVCGDIYDVDNVDTDRSYESCPLQKSGVPCRLQKFLQDISREGAMWSFDCEPDTDIHDDRF